MNDLRSQLQNGDPIAREGGLSHANIERMRRVVLSTSRDAAPAPRGVFFVLAAVLLLASVGGALLTRASLSTSSEQSATTIATSAAEGQPFRQLQFVAPGGTRVIWTFNPNLQVR